MDGEVKYNTQSVQVSSVMVEDVGNCALEAISEENLNYYLIITTEAGETKILAFGPVILDSDFLVPGYNLNYSEMEYKDKKLLNLIRKWALGPKGVNFESISQISPYEAITACKDASKYILN